MLNSSRLDMIQPIRLKGLLLALSKYLCMAQADLRRVRDARRRLEDAIKERDDAIKAAAASGETHRDIGKEAGLSFQRISQIVKEGRSSKIQ